MENRPTQLERMRKEHYDKLYARQPSLMERLFPFLNKAQLIERHTEPFLYSPNDPLSRKLVEPKQIIKLGNKRGLKVKKGEREKYKKELSKFSHSRRLQKTPTTKKISEIRPDVLYALSGMEKRKKRRRR